MKANRVSLTACGVALVCLTLVVQHVTAQEPVLEEFYGNGVHHYFAGQYDQAVSDLDSAIEGGSRDPRAYYFRGLAKQRAGYGGEADFQKGAELEAADTDQHYPVGRSLERVQGSTRMSIERYRSVARATALARQQRRDQERYETLRRRESQVLRAPGAAPATPATANEPAPAVAKPAVPPPPLPETPAGADPFTEDAVAKPAEAPAAVAPAAAPAEAVAQPPAAAPPVAADAPAADAPAGEMTEDPFAEPPAEGEAAPEAPAAPPAGAPPTPEPPAAEPPAAEAAPEPAKTDEPAKTEEEDPFATP